MAMTTKEWVLHHSKTRAKRTLDALALMQTLYPDKQYRVVLGFPQYIVSSDGDVRHIMRPTNSLIHNKKHTYPKVDLQGKICRIHRLVATTFIPNPGNFPQVNHKDGDKFNNNTDNLEWSTSRDNLLHAIRTGLKKAVGGQLHTNAKIDNLQAMVIFKLRGVVKQAELSRYFKISQPTISELQNKKAWGVLHRC